jgi:hypothetical protein
MICENRGRLWALSALFKIRGVAVGLVPRRRFEFGGVVVERQSTKKVVVSKAAVKKAGVRATKSSAKLEGRVVPAGYIRSATVAAYIAEQQPPGH